MSRVAVLETDVQHVNNQVTSLRSDVTSFRSSVTEALNSISSKLEQRSRPNWSLMISGMSLLLVIGGAVAIAYLKPVELRSAYQQGLIDQHGAKIEHLNESLIRHDERIRQLYSTGSGWRVAPPASE